MKKRLIGQSKNGKTVYLNMEGSHAATHIADTPGLLELVQEIIAGLELTKDSVDLGKDMGRPVGVADLVETGEGDKILYAKRTNRDNYTRFVLNRKAQPTNIVTVLLRKDADGDYELWSAWIGPLTPQFPGDEFATQESIPFWKKHALAWGNQAVQAGTEKDKWPWE